MKKIINTIMLLALTLLPALSLQTVPAYAASEGPSCGTSNSPKGQVFKGIGQTGSDCDDKGVDNAISAVVNVLSTIVGFASIIVIIVAGFRYITSAGDAGKISSAKNTLIYALVGITVAVLARFLVNFIITQVD